MKLNPPTMLAAIVASLALVAPLKAEIKNVVLIVADDMGYADTGITGVEDFETPHIDSIANDGAFLTQAYVTAAVCSPSRAGFITGRYQQRFGHEHNGGGPPPFGLPLTEKTLGDHFKAAGFATGVIGKWHLGEIDALHPMNRGFDEFVGHLNGGHGYFPSEEPGGGSYGLPILDGFEPATDWDEYLTTYFGRRAVDFIDRHAEESFFLYVAFNAPHTPMQAREEDLERFKDIKDDRRRKYAAMMYAMDEAIGRVLAELEEKGIADETAVVFMSDNGGPRPGDPSVNGSRNNPFKGGKSKYFEGGVRVPMFIKMPGVVSPGTTYDQPVSSLDLLPTMLAAAGKQPVEGVELDGVDLTPYLTGETDGLPHDRIFWRLGAAMGVIDAAEGWKLTIPQRRFGLEEDPDRPDMQHALLFHLSEDKGENNDLSSQEPERRQAMITTWREWEHDKILPLWGRREKPNDASEADDK